LPKVALQSFFGIGLVSGDSLRQAVRMAADFISWGPHQGQQSGPALIFRDSTGPGWPDSLRQIRKPFGKCVISQSLGQRREVTGEQFQKLKRRAHDSTRRARPVLTAHLALSRRC
jgi:hypothetical protein